MTIPNLLIYETPLLVLPSLAKRIGLEEAIFAQQIHYHCLHSRNVRDGCLWVYNTLEEWAERFPFWNKQQIGRIVRKLEEKGILITTTKYNKFVLDKTKWYRINYASEWLLLENDCSQQVRSLGGKWQTMDTFANEEPAHFLGACGEFYHNSSYQDTEIEAEYDDMQAVDFSENSKMNHENSKMNHENSKMNHESSKMNHESSKMNHENSKMNHESSKMNYLDGSKMNQQLPKDYREYTQRIYTEGITVGVGLTDGENFAKNSNQQQNPDFGGGDVLVVGEHFADNTIPILPSQDIQPTQQMQAVQVAQSAANAAMPVVSSQAIDVSLWQPEDIDALNCHLHQAGLPSFESEEVQKALVEFRLFWLGQGQVQTAAKWQHKFVKQLLHLKANGKLLGVANAAVRLVWRAYSEAYQAEYGYEPLRSVVVDKQVAQFVEQIGDCQKACAIVKFYVQHKNRWYQTKGHDFGTLLANIQAVTVDFQRNKQTTSTAVVQMEKSQENLASHYGALEILRNRGVI